MILYDCTLYAAGADVRASGKDTPTCAFGARELLVLLLAVASAVAQDYPSRNVSFIVPYQAGGATDLMARLVGQRLEQRLGKPFVVENRPGAGTVLAAAYVARQPADGYTIMLGTSTTMAINVTLYKSLPYDPDPGSGAGRDARRRAVPPGRQSGAADQLRSPTSWLTRRRSPTP